MSLVKPKPTEAELFDDTAKASTTEPAGMEGPIKTAHLEHASSLVPRDPDPVWKVSKSRMATLEVTADISQLRWVGTDFIHFLDIPWDYELLDKLTELADPQEHPQMVHVNEGEAATELSTRAITIGLLEDFMDMQIPEDCLLSYDQSGQRVLSADNLSRLVVPWVRELLNSDIRSNDPLHRGQYSEELLQRLTTALDDAVYSKAGSLVEDGPDTDMLCAIATMIASLESCFHAIWQPAARPGIVDATRMFSEVTATLRRKLAVRWGEQSSAEMERLFSGGIPFAAYAIAFAPTANHVADVDTANYRPKHAAPGCTCAFVKPPLAAVCESVRRNEVPIIIFNGTEVLVRSARDTPYVAVSHVWADGLGSTTEAGLPRCQMARLARLAGSIVPGGAFWQDGLCIPAESSHRNLAIALMAETYADAAKVLVLDEGLRTACSRETPTEECLLRIATSGWMQRIWTLQEGMFGRELMFELLDAVIDCTHFNGAAFSTARRVVPLFAYRRGDATALTYQPQLFDRPRCTVNDLIGLLRYRTTSKPQDEPVAISGLLGIDTRKLVYQESAEERMKELLIQVRELPRWLVLFGWGCLRLPLPNFGWAPRSLSDVLWPGDPKDPPAICTEDGLFGDFTIVRFPEVRFPEQIGIILIVMEHGRRDPRVFSAVLSPHFFCGRSITVGGLLIKRAELDDWMRDDAAAAVVFPPDAPHVPHPVDARPTLSCKFAAPASVRLGWPEKVETSRSRWAWVVAHATVEPLQKLRVI